MAQIPESVKKAAHINSLWPFLIYQGKVRDTYDVGRIFPDTLLMLASNRISIFDFVLNALVPKKGEVLTALTHFWLTKILNAFPNHLVESKKYQGRNLAFEMKHDSTGALAALCDIPLERTLAIKRAQVMLWEMVYRHHIGGSVWKEYQKNGTVAGELLPPGLRKWAKLDAPAFTPTTKSPDGHDEPVTVKEFMERTGFEGISAAEILSNIYRIAYNYGDSRGILILDTKFETDGHMVVDEALTPDSSRFVDKADWQEAINAGREPRFLDKEPVRIWGRGVMTPFRDATGYIMGINNLKTDDPKHLAFVHSLPVPEKVIAETTARYLEIFLRLTGMHLEEYQKTYLLL
jgi:phosphoribosylaminoimidazole-succinocarboxamide synthase